MGGGGFRDENLANKNTLKPAPCSSTIVEECVVIVAEEGLSLLQGRCAATF